MGLSISRGSKIPASEGEGQLGGLEDQLVVQGLAAGESEN